MSIFEILMLSLAAMSVIISLIKLILDIKNNCS